MSWLAAAAVAVPVAVTKGILTVRSRSKKDSSDTDRLVTAVEGQQQQRLQHPQRAVTLSDSGVDCYRPCTSY